MDRVERSVGLIDERGGENQPSDEELVIGGKERGQWRSNTNGCRAPSPRILRPHLIRPSHLPWLPPRYATSRARRAPWRALFLFLVVLGAIAGVVYWWVHSRLLESTDNAYVVGNITPISAQVGGAVVALFADDNMIVQPGDPIAQIDPIPFQVQVDQALFEFKQAIYDAQAAVVNVGFFQKDRKSLLEGAEAKRAEAEQGVDATEYRAANPRPDPGQRPRAACFAARRNGPGWKRSWSMLGIITTASTASPPRETSRCRTATTARRPTAMRWPS